MTSWYFSPPSVLLLLAASVALVLGGLAWQRRPGRGAAPLSFLFFGLAIWFGLYGLELASRQEALAVVFYRLGYLGVTLVPAGWLLFALTFTERLPRRVGLLLAGLALEPLLVQVALWTNSSHRLFFTALERISWDGLAVLHPTYGPLFWLHAVYSYALLLAGTVLLLLTLWRHSAYYRAQMHLILGAIALPWLVNLVRLLDLLPSLPLDLTPVGLLLSGIILLFGLYRTPPGALTPLARTKVVEVTDEGLLVLDATGRILDINPAACRMLQVQAEAVVGRPAQVALAVWPQWAEWLHSPDAESAGLEIQPSPGCWAELHYTPVRTPEGQPVGALLRLHDLTPRKRIEQALRESEARYRRLIEASPEAIFLLDAEGRFTLVNPQAVRLFKVENETALLGRSWCEFATSEDAPRLTATLRAVIQEEGMLSLDYVGQTAAGERFFAQATLLALRFPHNHEEHLEIMGLVRDITAFKAAQEELHYVAQEERRQRELAQALRQAALTVTASLDFNVVLEQLLEQVAQVVPYDSGSVILFRDDGKAYVAKMRGYEQFGPHVVEAVRNFVFNLEWGQNFVWMSVNKQPLIIADVSQDPNWIVLDETSYIRSWVGAPIVVHGETIGFFSLESTQPDFYRPEHAEMLMIFASHAGIALENARLFAEAQRRAVEAETLREAAAAVTSALNLEQVLDLIIANLRRVVPYDSCSVFLLEKGYVRLVRGAGFEHLETILGHRFPSGNPLVEEAFRTGRPVVLYDAQQDPRFQRWGGAEHIRGWIGLPLIARGQPIGYLTIDSRTPGAYTEEHARLAQAFANQAAIALENARLFEQVQQAAITDALTGLANRRHFFDLARREFARARRYGSALSLFILDVDNLKIVNDQGGHLLGDRLLQTVGHAIRHQLRQPDIAARYGGDEFIVLLPETTLEKAAHVAERIRSHLSREVLQADGKTFPISISVGVAELEATCLVLDDLIERADRALYWAKAQGKGCVGLWHNGAPTPPPGAPKRQDINPAESPPPS
ncbi:histidine kinase N-terminal 7TM domain-containing protein [Thermanaerothrix sp. 4228-RoL]|uniref:Histidine kinase N-terminal 7TM domain-containing protein n=2 Tax=Thermanaerothrix TaxID=1077886 RepID=A0ABU3NP28_9CHLR|nr:histidine kinase N-terminal 7TM domain-containing protein [Thermanaerothrix sp. 4228-RoL]MDT8898595.1 histidine kinase N-terminal 7TM domain-containing protein [Thermanaerothrix sp. 4228-RoL]